MNPESTSFQQTLHEDSYEYEGDIILAQEGLEWIYTYQNQDKILHNGNYYVWDKEYSQYKNITDTIDDTEETSRGQEVNVWNKSDFTVSSNLNVQVSPGAAGEEDYKFTTVGTEFSPTSEEFRDYVTKTGGFKQLAAGYGHGWQDYDEFFRAPLDDINKQFELGRENLAGKVGQTLMTSETEADTAMARSGFESYGQVDYGKKQQMQGVFGDYTRQVEELQRSKDINLAQFWKQTEEDFYAQTEEMDTAA